MTTQNYVIALGSNRRGRHGSPVEEVRAALAELRAVAQSRIVASAPLGPSIRRFANAVAVVESRDSPPAMLARLKRIERAFGRRRGIRWGQRVIDLDIIAWSGGIWAGRGLTIPHAALNERAFVLAPLVELVPDWRDPLSGLSARQLLARLTRKRSVPSRARLVGGP
ncbi:2-amino-4-hydroxy-6-hydroxymethyldihydropteridine diphosphokinase [Sphingomonas sp. SUN019]|uniref:2-amino-4-hydroxy-6- hydroxymethyldihydropteridine diphosphokinase n=1 Tax=Sphingomonas sp. SUN019 TaxID=2937788 RepID=UPI002164B0BB|nr:2-amino-4-hydroxy-6-hydroxymethyldihydropteridine diphosphokinase [Sphingomonas sp. SUN019]UVO50519.1 2-amino-4-hydroxy-6-hydroxymethyldihydropteridine diphosphokinase [Sphingomonas sp. SUN019]